MTEEHVEHPADFPLVAEDLGPAAGLDRDAGLGRHLPDERRDVDPTAPLPTRRGLRVERGEHLHDVVERREGGLDAEAGLAGGRRSVLLGREREGGGGGLVLSTCTPRRRRSAAPWASCVRSQPSSWRVSLPFDTGE